MFSHQPAQESKRKQRQSEEEMDAVGGRRQEQELAKYFAKPAKISLNLRKFRRFSEIFRKFSENGKFP